MDNCSVVVEKKLHQVERKANAANIGEDKWKWFGWNQVNKISEQVKTGFLASNNTVHSHFGTGFEIRTKCSVLLYQCNWHTQTKPQMVSVLRNCDVRIYTKTTNRNAFVVTFETISTHFAFRWKSLSFGFSLRCALLLIKKINHSTASISTLRLLLICFNSKN